MNDLTVVDKQTGEIISAAEWDDGKWEIYIRSADPTSTIFERAKRIHEFQEYCRARHGKRGGSQFTQFMAERFKRPVELEHGSRMLQYPWRQGEIVYFPLVNMQPIAPITLEHVQQLMAMSRRSYEYEGSVIQQQRIPGL